MATHIAPLQKATMTLVGTIIGAGIFGLPLIFSRVGFWPGTLLFGMLIAVVLMTHLLYAEVCMAFRQKMRLAGFASRELGRAGYLIASISHPLQLIGSTVLYLLLAGEFLATLCIWFFGRTPDPLIWSVVFAVVGGLIVLIGLKFMATVETWATWFLIAGMLTVVGLLYGPALASSSAVVSHWPLFTVPFGVFLFTLSGFPVIGEVVELAERKRRTVYASVILGTLIAALLSWLFGVCLAFAAPHAGYLTVQNLPFMLPCTWVWLIPLIGFLAVATSYVSISQELKASIRHDFHMPRTVAWGTAIAVPFLLLFLVPRDFMTLLGWMGTVFGGVNGLLIAVIGYRVIHRHAHGRRWLLGAAFVVATAYALGMIYQFIGPKL